MFKLISVENLGIFIKKSQQPPDMLYYLPLWTEVIHIDTLGDGVVGRELWRTGQRELQNPRGMHLSHGEPKLSR